VTLALLLAAGLSGCIAARATTDPDGPVTIRYAYWGGIDDVQVWEELARRFHASQNRVRVKLEHIAGQAYHPKLMAMTVGRCAPDVMAADDEPFPELAENGLFEDLGPWMERDGLRREWFYPQFFDAWVHREKVYSIPYLGHCLLIFYNKSHLRSAGLPEPPADWDWDEFTRYARKLTRDLDGDGRIDEFGFMRFNFLYSLPWVLGAGGNELDPAMTRCTLNTPEAIRGIRFAHDLTHRHRVTPLVTELPGMPLENMFLTGKIALAINAPWWLRHGRRAPDLEWDVQHMPRGPRGRSTRTTCEGIGMSAFSRHKEEAWEWVRFVVGEEGQRVICDYERGMPALRSVAERRFPNPRTPQHEERFLEAMEYARSQRIPVQFGENNIVIIREWDLMLLGKRTPEQVVTNIERDVNAIMSAPR
jgi:multiple sugar transport system substrate-binding protein